MPGIMKVEGAKILKIFSSPVSSSLMFFLDNVLASRTRKTSVALQGS